jgi:hypothetical protein
MRRTRNAIVNEIHHKLHYRYYRYYSYSYYSDNYHHHHHLHDRDMCGYWRGSQSKIKDIDESANRPGNVLRWSLMHLNGGGRNSREVMRGEKKKKKKK